MALQTDYLSIPARTLVPMLRNIESESPLSAKAKGALLNWNFILEKNSVAAGIYAMWERQLYTAANSRFVPAELKGLVSVQLGKIISWLQTPDARFGANPVSGRDAFLKETFEIAVKELTTKLGTLIDDWKYGQSGYNH